MIGLRSGSIRTIARVAVLTTTMLLLPVAASRAAAGTATDFVTRNGTQLMLGGRPFQFTGFNIYNANSDGWCGAQLNQGPALDKALTSMGPGKEVFRSWFFQPLAIDKTTRLRDWSGFDHTLQVADAHGLKVIATLTDQWGECGSDVTGNGYKDASWYTGGYRQTQPGMLESYRDWVADVVARYKDDPRIALWQLINEAEVTPCPPGDLQPYQTLHDWAADVSGLVKSIDPNHLVSLGTIGTGQCGADGPRYQQLHAIPTIDLCEYHDYGEPTVAMPGDQFNGLQLRIDQCNALNKPVFVGEAGIKPNDLGGTLLDRADAFQAKISAQFAAGVQGFLAWAWSPQGVPSSTLDNYDVGPGDPALAVLGNSPVITQVATGSEHTCALTSGNAVWCWGSNSNGQVGDRSNVPGPGPAAISGIPNDVTSITAGGEYTCALTATGDVWCWGTDQYSQFGLGYSAGNYNPVPLHIGGLPPGIVALDTGAEHTCARTNGGAVWCWGYNIVGQTGDGNPTQTATPAQVAGLSTGVDEIAVGGYHSCARLGAAVRCWGSDLRGQVGDGGTMDFSVPTPQDVIGLTGDAAAIASGTYHSCALQTDGSLWCWGHDGFGELGDGSSTDQPSAIRVPDLTGVRLVTAGMNRGGGSAHTCAVTADGVACWGSNWAGQLGDGTTDPSLVPVAVLGLPSDIRELDAGGNHTCAILASWSIECWGANSGGQLGDGTQVDSPVPVAVSFAPLSVPDPPTNVDAEAGDRQATVTWLPPANDGGSAIDRYVVTPSPSGSPLVVGASATQAIVTGLANGTSYTFSVVAHNAVGDSAPAQTATSVTPVGTPGPPGNVTAAGGDAEAAVTWSPPASNNGGAITGYTLAPRDVTLGVDEAPVSVTGTVTDVIVGQLTNGHAYVFTVTASNSAGPSSPSAPSNEVTPASGATTPSATSGVTSDATGGSVTTDTGSGPTATDPVTTSVEVPPSTGDGMVSIAEGTVTTTAPSGYEFLDTQINIVSTANTDADHPLAITFTIDGSRLLQYGETPQTLVVFRSENGGTPTIVPTCTAVPPATLIEDPCIPFSSRLPSPYVPGDDGKFTVLTSSASAWNIAPLPAAVITVGDTGYAPKTTQAIQAQRVMWSFISTKAHSATDAIGLGPKRAPLFDSGRKTTPGTYTYRFPAAGTYPYRSTAAGDPSFAGSIGVPMRASKGSTQVDIPFMLTWSSASITGYAFDVQYRFKAAGSSKWGAWTTWQKSTGTSAGFTPTKVGIYDFHSRLRNTSTGRESLYSPDLFITVT